MPGSILNTDINFPHFTGNESTEQKIETIQNYLFMLYEQLRYSMGNLGTENFSEGGIKGIEQIVAQRIDLSGYVTFSSLSEPGKTVINGANLMTGTVTADEVVANISIEAPNVLGGEYKSADGSAVMTLQGGSAEGMGIRVDNAANEKNILFVEQESMGESTTTDMYLQDAPLASFVGGEMTVYSDGVVPNSGALRIYVSGKYWEIGDGEIVLYDNSGTELNRVVLEA